MKVTTVVTRAGVLFGATATALYQNGSAFAPCDSPVYCYGNLLHEIELARPFTDSKTFVDLPTIRPLDEVLTAFNALPRPISNNSDLNTFLTTYFGQAGSELAPVPQDQLQTNATFLESVQSADVKDFLRQVIDIWPDLTRTFVGSANCTGCVTSFIPVNRTFVVAGGRFREPYYWDSFWIIEGLLRTGGSFTKIARNMIENFFDFVEKFGFVPNGARIYYLNRSQPPLLTQMVAIYLEHTNDVSILERGLPILELEHSFWTNNRTVIVTVGGKNYTLNRYGVSNTQPRPESYREDYVTVNNHSYYAESGIIYPETPGPLSDDQKANLYANLATGAESGIDYSTRWLKTPLDAVNDVYFPLRSLNLLQTVPVDLNSILYMNEVTIASLHNRTGNTTAANNWAQLADARSTAIEAVMWNGTYNSFFDYNLTASAQNVFVAADEDATSSELFPPGVPAPPQGFQLAYYPAQFYPFWTGAAKPYLKNNPFAVLSAYQRVADLFHRKPGSLAASNSESGQQWDEPNVWPPLVYVIIKGLLNTPATFSTEDPSYKTVQQLAFDLSQRYLDSTFCTWRATGGSTPNLPRLQSAKEGANGIIFEKYSDKATNVAGSGGEYEVVEGFGWTNGVLIWIADLFGKQLKTPTCNFDSTQKRGLLLAGAQKSAVELHKRDAKWVKLFPSVKNLKRDSRLKV